MQVANFNTQVAKEHQMMQIVNQACSPKPASRKKVMIQKVLSRTGGSSIIRKPKTATYAAE
jgi:hypothetical protein